MNSLISNYINGNLKEAKRQASKMGGIKIVKALQEHGFGAQSSIAIAAFLKGIGTFQEACDAEHAERSSQ